MNFATCTLSARQRRHGMNERVHAPMLALLAGLVCAAGSQAMAQSTVDGCTSASYLDRSAAGADRTFAWDYAFAGDPERCITVRVGQSVRWVGNFGDHPLDPDEGDQPNPIANHTNGEVVFTREGVYGYRCSFHLAMRGAIRVVGSAAPVPVLGSRWSWLLAIALAAAGTRILRRQ